MVSKSFHINKILVPVDFSISSANATAHAIGIANQFNAELELLHVVESFSITAAISHAFSKSQTEFEGGIEKKSTELLSGLLSNTQLEAYNPVHTHLAKGKVHKTIIEFAEKLNADLIVMGTHGQGETEDHVLGGNATRVIMGAHCPVISVQSGSKSAPIKNILLPIDNSAVSRQKVRFAVELAKKYKSIVHVLGAFSSSDLELQRKFEVKINQVGYFLDDHEITNSVKLVKGDQLSQIVLDNLQQINPDLVLVMTEQEGSSLFLGNAAQHIINHSRVPVMTIRPSEGNPDSISVGY